MSLQKLKSLPIGRIRAAFEYQRSAGSYPDRTDIEERHILYSKSSSARMISLIPGSAVFSYITRSDEAALRRSSTSLRACLVRNRVGSGGPEIGFS
jgi:hypothetical protein